MKNAIKTNLTKTEKIMTTQFDRMVIDYLRAASNFGFDTLIAEAYKNEAIGVLRCLALSNVISEDLWNKCLNAIYSVQKDN